MDAYRYPFRSADESLIDIVWNKARPICGLDPGMWRVDRCGALICRSYHGVELSYGWEIDHEQPRAKGESDDLANLQPLHWRNNRHKADDWPDWSCQQTS